MVYVKATLADPGYFYANLGYQGLGGIKGTWWRIPFNASHPWGLKYNTSINEFEVQRFNRDLVPARYELTDECDGGICPPNDADNWQPRAQDPQSTAQNGYTGPAEPFDLIVFERQDGTADHVLLLYTPEARYGQIPPLIYYVKGTMPATSTSNFQWSPQQSLDTSMFWDRSAYPQFAGTYNACGAGGGYFMSANYSGTLFGFASTWRSDLAQRSQSQALPPACGTTCANQMQGLLPFSFKLQNLGVDWVSPQSGPMNGNTPVTVSGSGFVGAPSPPPSVSIGGSALTGVSVANATKITGFTSSHAAGVAYLKVTNPNQESDLRANAFVYDFADVPAGHPYHDDVVAITRNRVTSGCGSNSFCPESPITRAQMAVFLLVAAYGFGYVPPLPTGTYFQDVAVGSFAAEWIEQLFRAGITSGCSGTTACNAVNPNALYCPNQGIPREQMAVFLLRAKFGPDYQAPACTVPMFTDVPCSSGYARWINKAVEEQFMSGCGGSNFCPTADVRRKEMAQHLRKAFQLP